MNCQDQSQVLAQILFETSMRAWVVVVNGERIMNRRDIPRRFPTEGHAKNWLSNYVDGRFGPCTWLFRTMLMVRGKDGERVVSRGGVISSDQHFRTAVEGIRYRASEGWAIWNECQGVFACSVFHTRKEAEASLARTRVGDETEEMVVPVLIVRDPSEDFRAWKETDAEQYRT